MFKGARYQTNDPSRGHLVVAQFEGRLAQGECGLFVNQNPQLIINYQESEYANLL